MPSRDNGKIGGTMALTNWRAPDLPARQVFRGRYARLEPLSRKHEQGLFAVLGANPQVFEYMPIGPFSDLAAYQAWLDQVRQSQDTYHFAVCMADGALGGTLSLLRMQPAAGSIEVGWVTFSPRLQRTREATEAVFLLMDWAFAAGYRRFEWKCDGANIASRRAAQRFGFSFEGVHRQAGVVKGRNRDTAWFSVLDTEWPALRAAFADWLAPGNFDEAGQQKQALSVRTAPLLQARDPLV
jgi:RimJ/RimL family protein N-acetyltransferase